MSEKPRKDGAKPLVNAVRAGVELLPRTPPGERDPPEGEDPHGHVGAPRGDVEAAPHGDAGRASRVTRLAGSQQPADGPGASPVPAT